jgi:hypothetical protein
LSATVWRWLTFAFIENYILNKQFKCVARNQDCPVTKWAAKSGRNVDMALSKWLQK